ncbi:MAG TPA: hypothetical protein VF323_12825, partial [Candidatus Limnocylindrales bacterium]
MHLTHDGAQRASVRSVRSASELTSAQTLAVAPRRRRLTRLVPLAAAALGVAALGILPASTSAATAIHVVVVAGPVESQTAKYIADGRALAAQARSYGAVVTQIYSPNATWSKVRAALKGADLLIYLGHGNGWPSPYAPFRATSKDGLGLNAAAGHGNSNVTYYGESYLVRYIRMAPHAVVILNHLCYSAGNSEIGRADPSRTVATQRIDNFGAGFLRTGADVVFAEPRGNPSFILADLFHSSKTMKQIFWDSRQATHTYAFSFTSKRTPGATAISDPAAPG